MSLFGQLTKQKKKLKMPEVVKKINLVVVKK